MHVFIQAAQIMIPKNRLSMLKTVNIPRPFSALRSCITALLCAPLLFASLTWAAADDSQQKKFEEVKRSIEKLQGELKDAKGDRDNLHQNLEENEKNIQQLNEKARELKKALEEKQKRLKVLNNEQAQLEKKKNEQVGLVEDYTNAAYRLGKQSQIRLLLNQEDPAQVARMLKYYNTFSENRSEQIAIFVDTIKRLKAIEPEIAGETQKLQQAYSDLKDKQKQLKGSQRERQNTLALLESKVKSQEQRLASLKADQRRLEKVLTRVYKAINDQELNFDVRDFAKLKGKLPWPTQGKPSNRFGSRRSDSSLKWQGLEIRANPGTNVVAIHYGQVVFSDYLRGHGLLMIIDHGSGYMSLYAHNENLYKEIGEWVEAGEAVATVGNTGGRRDTALYFELRHNGKPTNPTPWLKRA